MADADPIDAHPSPTPDDGDPQAASERRQCSRHLLQHPLTCAEHDPELFRLIRRHEAALDRWFTQRLGYRLHIDADTARLFKTGVVPEHRPLRTHTDRALTPQEHTLLALALAATAAGPAIISLRDLVAEVRSAAAEADIALRDDHIERRAFVAVLRWMIDHGLASELYEHIDAYVADSEADAVLRLRPDRIALLPIPALIGAEDPAALLARADRRSNTRQWMRCRLVEDPVVYRDDLDASEWLELRRRLSAEERFVDEMFGLVLEARAEGVAAIDPTGALADHRFPTTGTVGHAALLLIGRLAADEHGDTNGDTSGDGDGSGDDGPRQPGLTMDELAAHLGALIEQFGRGWAKDLTDSAPKLTRRVVDLLVALRLGEVDPGSNRPEHGAAPQDDRPRFHLRPAAARFVAIEPEPVAAGEQVEQGGLW